MIFGIKTKKDKKIEELQTELDTLKMSRVPVKYTSIQSDVETLESSYILTDNDRLSIINPDKRTELIKEILFKQLVDTIYDKVEFTEYADFKRERNIYTARLRVVVNK